MPEQARQDAPTPALPAPAERSAARQPERPAGRQIRGRTLAERQRERRDAMLVAGLELFGTKGVAHTRVEEVCRRAGVSTRNFYEEFDDRLSLLVAVGEQIVAGLFAAWSDPAAGARATEGLRPRVAAVVQRLADDPRVARVAFVEGVGIDPTHESLRRDMLRVFPTWLAAYMKGRLDDAGVPDRRQETMAVAAFATAHELVADWSLRPGDERIGVDELLDEIMAMGAAIYALDGATKIR